MEKQRKQILGLKEELAKLQSASSEQAILLGKKDLQMQTLRVKCSGLVNDRKARDEKIKSLKAQAKEKVSATEKTIVEKKVHPQVEVAQEKMLLKADSKDLEFERKMN
jgi:hypothetical protein